MFRSFGSYIPTSIGNIMMIGINMDIVKLRLYFLLSGGQVAPSLIKAKKVLIE